MKGVARRAVPSSSSDSASAAGSTPFGQSWSSSSRLPRANLIGHSGKASTNGRDCEAAVRHTSVGGCGICSPTSSTWQQNTPVRATHPSHRSVAIRGWEWKVVAVLAGTTFLQRRAKLPSVGITSTVFSRWSSSVDWWAFARSRRPCACVPRWVGRCGPWVRSQHHQEIADGR